MSFFESMSIAGSERIHTQMISWLLTECKTYSVESKSAIICAIFKIDSRIFKNIACHTEYRSIDLLVVADDFLGALENKLKASQRPDQLKDYWIKLQEAIPEHFQGTADVRGTLLALTNEPPADPNWVVCSYLEFFKTLAALEQRDPARADTVIVNEYIASLGRMTSVVKEFQNHHQRFPNVFSDGFKTKHRKSGEYVEMTPSQHYIRSSNMETILQKAFLRTILAEMGVKTNEATLEESRGTGFFEIPLRSINYKGHRYSIGFQLQGKTIKLNIGGREYRQSRPEWIDEPLKTSFNAMVIKAGYPPRLHVGHAHAYLSGTQSLPKHFDGYTRPELITVLKAHYETALRAAKEWALPSDEPESRR